MDEQKPLTGDTAGLAQTNSVPADASSPPAAPKKKRWRGPRRTHEGYVLQYGCLLRCLVLFLVSFLVFTVVDVKYLKWKGVRETSNIGRRTLHFQYPHYAISPDRKEIIVSYDLQTAYYDTPSMRPSRITSDLKETRIPLDPMSDSVVKCFVEVTFDPLAPPPDRIWFGTLGGSDGASIMCLQGGFEPGVDLSEFEIASKSRREMPDGMTYRLTVRPEDMPLLSESFFCRMRGLELLMIPWDRDGDRYVMLSPRNANSTPFFHEVQAEHPDILSSTWDEGFPTLCRKILYVPLGALFDMFVGSVFNLYLLFIFSNM